MPSRTHAERRRPAARRAFTILELLIVIAILLAIGGLVLVNVLGQQDRADEGLVKVQMKSFENAFDQFRADMRRYPTEEEGVAALWSKSVIEDEADAEAWKGPYLREPSPNDQWNNAWVYRSPSEIEGLPYDLISMGPDGEEGTDDDISNNDDRMGEDGGLSDDFAEFGGGESGAGSGG